MLSKLTNLLPRARRKVLAREYLYRLGVVSISLFIMLVVAAGVLLLPTYVFLLGSASAKETRLASIKSALASTDEVAISARLTALSNDAAALIALSNAVSPTKIITETLAVPRPGVTLSGFVYTPAVGKNAATFALSGVAATRDALRAYQLTLQSAPFVLSADLPVSAYAQDTKINFTITLTLSP